MEKQHFSSVSHRDDDGCPNCGSYEGNYYDCPECGRDIHSELQLNAFESDNR